MAIKKLTFSFEVPITELLGLIASRNSGLKIDVLGDDRATPKFLNGHAPKLLESPRAHAARAAHANKRNEVPSYQLLIKAMAANPEHTKSTADLGKVLEAVGLSPRSVSPQMTMIQKKGWAKRVDAGVYQLTAKGALQADRLGFDVHQRRVKPKPKKPKKRPPPSTPDNEPAQVAEQSHGEG